MKITRELEASGPYAASANKKRTRGLCGADAGWQLDWPFAATQENVQGPNLRFADAPLILYAEVYYKNARILFRERPFCFSHAPASLGGLQPERNGRRWISMSGRRRADERINRPEKSAVITSFIICLPAIIAENAGTHPEIEDDVHVVDERIGEFSAACRLTGRTSGLAS